MRRFNLDLAPKKPSDPLTLFLDQLESNMREACCSEGSIAEFKELFANPDPESLYAQNILTDLQANRYAPESVERHITRMHDFRKKCYSQLNIQDPTARDLTNLQTLELDGKQLPALPGEIGRLTNLQTLKLHNNQLADLPDEIGELTHLKTLKLHNNQLAALPDAIGKMTNLKTLFLNNNQLADLPDVIGKMKNLRSLWLRNNQFTTVPRALLDLPAETEIDLQGNLLPDAEINAVNEELERRRARGQAVPKLILPALAADREDAIRVAAAEGTAHQQPLTDAFQRRLDELAKQFPDNLKGTIEEQCAEMKTIEERLSAALEPHAANEKRLLATLEHQAANNPNYDAARYKAALDVARTAAACEVARTMFEKGYGQHKADYNDFRYSSGHVLSYVVLAMEAQLARTPDNQFEQAQENGLNNLIVFLADGHNLCDTRHIEDVLQLIGIPLSQYAQDNPDIIGATPVSLSADQIRDATFPVAKLTLRDIARQTPDLTDDAFAFRTALTRAMHAEHPGVTQAQIDAYLDTNILPVWGEFKEHALGEEGPSRE